MMNFISENWIQRHLEHQTCPFEGIGESLALYIHQRLAMPPSRGQDSPGASLNSRAGFAASSSGLAFVFLKGCGGVVQKIFCYIGN
jgi:hypothetical protein